MKEKRLLTKEQIQALPNIEDQIRVKDPIVYAHLYLPCPKTYLNWLVFEYDGNDVLSCVMKLGHGTAWHFTKVKLSLLEKTDKIVAIKDFEPRALSTFTN